MLKRSSIVSSLGAFLLFSSLPSVQAANATTTPDGGSTLGMVEGVLSFCSKVNLPGCSSYSQMDELFLTGQNPKAIDQVRDTDAYEDAFEQITKKLRALFPKDAFADKDGDKDRDRNRDRDHDRDRDRDRDKRAFADKHGLSDKDAFAERKAQ